MGIITETNFFGGFQQSDEPKVLIVPVPYEYTTSHVKGTKNGPQAILNASTRLEPFDDELWLDQSAVGINTSNFATCEFVNNKSVEPFNEIEEAVRQAVISGSLPILLGGEQSIFYGGVKAVYDLYPDVSIINFSADTNLRENHKNNKFNSLCTLRRIKETMPDVKIVQIGIRDISKEEAMWLEKENHNIEIYFARERKNWNVAEILGGLSKNVCINLNFNVFDTSIMPSVSRSQPGGLSWEETVDILKNICTFKDIVGMSFVDFSPIQGLLAPDFLAAKLIYKTIGYTFARQLGVFEEEKTSTLVSSDSL